ncbi:Glycosyl transferase, family 2 [sediment metagenome]|uniref:Glycosyl transferase, family 2 n=3 Tax=unclassified sequences TaxID=12908 RepID=D9PJP1_9ZZZZ
MNAETQAADKGRVVDVLLVNWNTGACLERCLESLFRLHPELDLRALVVDNASRDGSEAAAGKFGRARLIVNSANRGFAAAVNQALAEIRSNASYLLVLNPDTEFRANVLTPLMQFLDSSPQTGIVTPWIEGPDGRFQATCRRREPSPAAVLAHLTGLAGLFPRHPRISGYTYGGLGPELPAVVEAVSGSFMLVRREVFERLGGFDERYFMYAEDLEFCRRARLDGWEIAYRPLRGVVHHGAVSSGGRRFRSLWHKHCSAVQYLNSARRGDYAFPVRWLLSLAVLLLFPPRAFWMLLAGGRRD